MKKKTVLALVITFLIALQFGIFSSYIGMIPYSIDSPPPIDEHEDFESEKLYSQDISVDNTYSGIGAPWNITHWANRTDYDLPVTFSEGSSDMVDIPLGAGWEGYKLITQVSELRDERNWNNGSFNYGADDGDQSAGDDDSLWIANSFQNWTFGLNDTGLGTNEMSGNYLSNIGGQDCLELRMDSYDTYIDPTTFRTYDPDDSCWWGSTIQVPRGRIIDSQLNFELYPNILARFNSWAFAIYINSLKVYSIGTFTLSAFGVNSWHSFSIPQNIWLNTSNVFPSTPLINNPINIQLVLECVGGGNYSGFANIDYQRLYVDNVELIISAEALPSDLDLKVNQTTVNDIGWGTGTVELNGDWQTSRVYANYTTDDVGQLGSYDVDFETALNLFARKHQPDTNYETNTASIGTKFTIENASNASWEAFGFIAEPTGYSESEMRLNFPQDVTITAVYTSDEPSNNIIGLCDTSTAGTLSIPVNQITTVPDGFWRFLATSPNYCENLLMYNNATGSWIEKTEYISGEYINITAQITNSPIISSYIDQTNSILRLRFPNGTIWSTRTQIATVDSNGHVNFNPISIPTAPPDYEAGWYEAIITWNNSFLTNGLNETGIIYKRFRVSHYSELTPEQDYFENVLEGTVINIKVAFSDKENFNAIEGALVYSHNFTHPSVIQYFGETIPGFYILELNTTGALAGDNIVTIYANSSEYVNTESNITIDITKQTVLTIDNDFLTDVSYQSNFTVQFNYTERYGGAGIEATFLSTDWAGEYHFNRLGQGIYELTCNASGPGYNPGKLYTLILNVGAENNIPQSVPIRVLILSLESIIELYINGSQKVEDDFIEFQLGDFINVTVKYLDAQLDHLSGASVRVTIGEDVFSLSENPGLGQYETLLNASAIGEGIDYLTVFANKTFYNTQSIRSVLLITQRITRLEIYLNEVNVTADPSIELPISSMVNLTVKYLDYQGNHISGATVSLSGDYSNTLSENGVLGQYSIIIDTNNLGVGIKLITISASKENYEFQADDLRMEVRRIYALIQSENGQTIFRIRPGESITLRVILNDTDFGINVTGQSVKYFYMGEIRDMTEIGSTGVYEAEITNIPTGSHVIYVAVEENPQYLFVPLQVTVSASIPPAELFWIWILIIALAVATGIVIISYVLYRKVYRFPKPVRKVRKYRKTLPRERDPQIDIDTRKKAFIEAYNQELETSSKFLKGGRMERPPVPEKIEK